MSTTEQAARPKPRAFWADLRFVLGVVLILASVFGVWAVVAAARQTVPVFAAREALVPGEPVDSGSLEVVEVALGALDERYLSPASLQPGDVATRTIAAGELVPAAAVGGPTAASTTTLVVESAGEVSGSIAKGTVVEVWSAPRIDQSSFDAPRILVPTATVVAVDREDAVVGSAGVRVEIVVQRADVADVLSAIAAGDAVSIVPGGGKY